MENEPGRTRLALSEGDEASSIGRRSSRGALRAALQTLGAGIERPRSGAQGTLRARQQRWLVLPGNASWSPGDAAHRFQITPWTSGESSAGRTTPARCRSFGSTPTPSFACAPIVRASSSKRLVLTSRAWCQVPGRPTAAPRSYRPRPFRRNLEWQEAETEPPGIASDPGHGRHQHLQGRAGLNEVSRNVSGTML